MNSTIISATLDQALAPPAGIPIAVLESLLHEYLADQSAVITACWGLPFPHQGTNDSTTFLRVTLTWELPMVSMRSHTTTWIIKHWKAGGVRDRMLGITQPHDVLAWEQGWLRPSALPDGMIIPFIGARRSPDNREAWLAMADVSTELSAYQRMSLSADLVLSRAQTILARLAHFHAMWERPERQAALQSSMWLRHPQTYVWDMATTYARALGHSPVASQPPEASAPPVWASLSVDLHAFLEDRPADERRLWERVLIDRRGLVEGLSDDPLTLLHNDLDDRNIGLRWPDRSAVTGSSAVDPSALVLIDWEWMAVGPAAIDIANLILRLPIMVALGTPIPAIFWTNELADYYFAHYRAAGGRCVDALRWRRSYGLAVVVQGISQMPFLHGSLRRAIRGEIPPPQIVGVADEVVRQNLMAGLPMMEQMEARVIRAARRWLD